jgi:hypothetical protein
VRYNILLDLNKYIVIDTINFFHSFGYIKLKELALQLHIKNIEESNNLELIKNVFFKLYIKYTKTIT